MNPLRLFTILTIVPAVTLLSQEAALPPLPGMITSGALPNADSSVLIAQGGDAGAEPAKDAPAPEAAPKEPATEAPAPEGASLAAADPAKPAAPSDLPPGPGNPAGKSIDFMQRSNLVLSMILENDRGVDPFGLVMDPANAKATPILAEQYQEEEEPTVLNSSSLKTALMSLPITGVYPKKEVVVIGARAFPVGGQFGMKLQELTIRLRFEGIRGGEIYFKDMETREVTSVPFNTRPAEFEPLSKESKPVTGEGISSMGELFIAN